MMIFSGLCGRAGTCLFFFPTMFIRQTGYQVSQCVYGKAGKGGFQTGGGWPLSFIFSFSLPCLSLYLSSLSFLFLALPIYTLLPSVVDVSWALTFFSFPHLALRVLPRIIYLFQLVHHAPAFNHHHHHHQRLYLIIINIIIIIFISEDILVGR